MEHPTYPRPGHLDEQEWLRQLQSLAEGSRQASEGYAEHLARVTPDADRNRALLQAQYRALHGEADAKPGGPPPEPD